MKLSAVGLVLSCVLCLSTSASAQDAERKAAAAVSVDPQQAVADTLGARHWGMSKAELIAVLEREIQDAFERKIRTERDIMRQDSLYQESQQRLRRIRENYVQFSGTKTGWDVSPVASEFAHGNDESMLVVQNANSRDLYFFMRGRLWKWYRELAGDAAAQETLRELGGRLGRGKPQQDRLNESSQEPYSGVMWVASGTRVTALRRGPETCLVLEDKSVVDRLANLRAAARTKAPRARAGQNIDWALLPGSSEQAQAQAQTRP